MGCQMNVYDSDLLSQVLETAGFSPVEDAKVADVVIINTCTVRGKPEQKALSLIGRMARFKRNRPGMVLGVSGCLAQQRGAALMERFPAIDFVMGPRELDRFHEILAGGLKGPERIIADRLDPAPPQAPCRPGYFKGTAAGRISIMEGCNNFCSYCVVPYVRGREMSRPPAEIIQEAQYLVSEGVKDITLLGQNVNSYRWGYSGPVTTFADLLKALDALPGLLRIRFTTSHPKDLGPDLVRSFVELEHLSPHIHLPFQAGSDAVLKSMRRGYTRERYLALVESLREVRPDMAITSDVMVGFPGETEEDFERTMDLIERVRFDGLFSFKYSDRPGTPAASMGAKVAETDKSSRLARLQARQKQITLEKNRELEGGTVEVLVEGESRRGGQLTGRTGSNKIVNLKQCGSGLGDLVLVEIKQAFLNSLRGQAVAR